MKFQNFENHMLTDCVNLWNEVVNAKKFYKPFTEEEFVIKFLKNENFRPEGFFVVYDGKKLVGISLGVVKKADLENENAPGYVTFVLVKETYRRKGLGTQLVEKVEGFLKELGRKSSRMVFLGAINLEWYVPDTNMHNHPGAPAVPYNSLEYFLYLSCGYNVEGQVDAFHLDLTKFEMSEKNKAVIERNEKQGIGIEIYDPKKHHSLEEFCVEVNNPPFANAIRNNQNAQNPRPLLIAHDNGKVIAFTGPVWNEGNNRASLAGIAVLESYNGKGIGKTLFSVLCAKSKENGSEFMTFFTGLNNIARNIYLSAGFKIVQSFAIMKKDLK